MSSKENNLAKLVLNGDRRALAQAITLIESTRDNHRNQAENLLEEILPMTGKSIRLAITGVPGVGKSTFIETFGLHLVSEGHRVAVLAVDPTSQISGGSILGDKTRMDKLSQSKDAFIRPTPTAGSQGGVARRTREVMLAFEAANFDVILVETVGVGQSETAVADMVDMFLLLLLPGSGDELQGLKRGIVELADLVIVNKADREMLAAAERVAVEYKNALNLLRPLSKYWDPRVVTCSALEGKGIGEIWKIIEDYRLIHSKEGAFEKKRLQQAISWMWREVDDSLLTSFRSHSVVQEHIMEMEKQVELGSLTPSVAAKTLLDIFSKDK
ncbi:MAG: methylmalonyl Co-A mutase-associated GTPase MeaB [Rhodospirillaceae bacterium]|nr:methylmalonyl Co-A mutase-associated GTPase MeaB [Rhodospirillaceae bacterium]|tara:strand:+ start:562 stop:1545 length:984 start_codon:yes stop_codon:yes gene_type:complete